MKFDLHYYFAVLIRRLHYIAITFAAVTALSAIVAFRLTPEYESSARLLLEGAQIPDALAAPTVETAALEQLQIIEQRLMTRQNLLEIARKFNVLPQMGQMTPDDIVEAMRKSTRITKQAGRDQATLMTITFSAERARATADVVNEYVTRILADSTATRTGQAQDTMQFFRQEVDRLSTDMSTQSAKILEFQNKNADALPDTLDYRLSQQANLQERQAGIDREIAGLKDQRQRLIEIYRSTGQLDSDNGLSQTPEAQQLAQLQSELSQAKAVLAPTNPKVVLLQKKVDELQARVAAQSAATTPETPEAPVMTPLDIQTTQIDAQITQLESQRADVAKQLAALKDSIDRTSSVSVQLAALQRDYENIQGQYNTATDRLSKASTGERIEALSKGQRIGVLDAATVPDQPARPNRIKLITLGAVAGLALGIGLVGLLEILNSSIRRPIDLERHLDIVPIGTIPYTRTPRETLGVRLTIVLVLALAGAGIPAAVWLIDTYYMPVDLILDRINSKLGL